MFRRYVAPILRLLAFLGLLASPLLLAAIARAEEPEGKDLVALRSVVLGETPGGRLRARRARRGQRSRPGSWSATAAASSSRRRPGARFPRRAAGPTPRRSSSSTTRAEPIDRLVGNARLLLEANDRPVLAAAYLHEVTRRDASRVEAWELLGRAGELLAASARPGEGRARARLGRPRAGLGRDARPEGRRRAGTGTTARPTAALIALAPPAETRRARAPPPPDRLRAGRGSAGARRRGRRLAPRTGPGRVSRLVPGVPAPRAVSPRARAPPVVARGGRRPPRRRRGLRRLTATARSSRRPRSRPRRRTRRAAARPTASWRVSRSRFRARSSRTSPSSPLPGCAPSSSRGAASRCSS